MKKEVAFLAKHRLEKAKNTLMDAKKYFEEVTSESTVNRAYYAMFYAVNALLLANGLSSSKHAGVRGLFNKEIVNKGLIEKEIGRFYSEMFDRRQKGDYKDFVEFEKADVGEWLIRAEGFIKKLEKLTLEIIGEVK